MESLINSLMEDLPELADPRLVDQLAHARARFFSGLELLPPVPSPIVTREEMAAHQMNPKHLGNIRPPSVVSKIVGLVPENSEWITKLIAPLRDDEDIKSRIQELCLALNLLGFARDKGIAKDDPQKSDDGARAQLRDISHICAAAVCDLFITADRRCAKLAFAVFEALKLRTAVLHLLPGKADVVNLGLVGSDYWP